MKTRFVPLVALALGTTIGLGAWAAEKEDHGPWTDWYLKGNFRAKKALAKTRSLLLQGQKSKDGKAAVPNNIHDPNARWESYGKQADCTRPESVKFRTADGTCNDVNGPLVGSAGVAFGRNIPPAFIDQDGDSPAKLFNPPPAEVSRVFFKREEFKPVPWLNMLAASWIQFMNHDWLTHGKNVEYDGTENSAHQVPGVASTAGTVEKTKVNTAPAGTFKREFGNKVTLNDVTHWWDGSQIYGSSQAEQDTVRGIDRAKTDTTRPWKLVGKMVTSITEQGREVLPLVPGFSKDNNKQNQGDELTGFRDNWWVGLSMLHTLFVKEHNAIADELIKKHVTVDTATGAFTWKNGDESKVMNANELDEQVFQTARLINAAVMAKIHTVEWTPAILDHPVARSALYTNWYGALNPQTMGGILKHFPGFSKTDFFEKIDLGFLLGGIVGSKTNNFGTPFSITEEFTSVYRLHSLLPEKLEFKRLGSPEVEKVDFALTRNELSREYMAGRDLKDLFYSFGTQNPGQLVLNNFPEFMRDFTVKTPQGDKKMDLAMVDVLRDRERGVPRYNQFRRAIKLTPITKYADFFPGGEAKTPEQQAILAKFYAVYGRDAAGNDNIEMIDLLVGTSAEEVRPVAKRDRHGKLKGNGFGFGETMFQIFILMASRRLMADRFFTDYYKKAYYTETGMDWIDNKAWFHEVIARHMPELKPRMKGLKSAFFPWN